MAISSQSSQEDPLTGDFIERILEQYYQYMTGPNRGRGETSMQNEVYVIRRILKFIGIDQPENLKKILDLSCLERYIAFLKTKNTLASSIKK